MKWKFDFSQESTKTGFGWVIVGLLGMAGYQVDPAVVGQIVSGGMAAVGLFKMFRNDP
jgi:hypothetical protein